MKINRWILGLVVSLASFCYADDAMDELIDERIKVNEEYRDEFADLAKESEFAEQLVPLEKKNGQEWVDYLKYVRTLNDKKLKIHVLRLEYMEEVITAYGNLEYAEGVIDKTAAQVQLNIWKKKLEDFEKLVTEDAKAASPTE